MKFGIVVFPGSNCDRDMQHVLQHVMGQKTVMLWHKDHDLQGCDMVFCPGGFSYGDYLRSGAIARFSPIMEQVIAHANRGGYLMGICNGFQILTEANLVPGTLLHNESRKFICKNVFLKPQTTNTLHVLHDGARDGRANHVRNGNRGHEQGNHFGSARTWKPVGQIEDDAWKKPSLSNTK